ncbi:MAG: response regulator [Arcobacteraceae bacterium]|nr:response regulator [Arcobacteraceae bacterium]
MSVTNKHILYLEDDIALSKSCQRVLSLYFEQVVHASNGIEGLKEYNHQKFDLILTDIQMPLMDGIEFIKNIRKKDTIIPIYVISSLSKHFINIDGLDVAECFDKTTGMRDFLASVVPIKTTSIS